MVRRGHEGRFLGGITLGSEVEGPDVARRFNILSFDSSGHLLVEQLVDHEVGTAGSYRGALRDSCLDVQNGGDQPFNLGAPLLVVEHVRGRIRNPKWSSQSTPQHLS